MKRVPSADIPGRQTAPRPKWDARHGSIPSNHHCASWPHLPGRSSRTSTGTGMHAAFLLLIGAAVCLAAAAIDFRASDRDPMPGAVWPLF